MTDINVDPFGELGKTDETTAETFPLTPKGGGTVVVTHAQVHEASGKQETSLGGESQRTRLKKDYVKDLYKKLFKLMGETPEIFHFHYFRLEDWELYYIGRNKHLTYGGTLRMAKELNWIWGDRRLRKLGFNIPKGKVTAEQAVMLKRVEEELSSESDVAKADDIELQEIAKSTEDLIAQFEGQETLPMHEILGLDKQLRSIRGSLKVEVAKKVQLEESNKKKSASSRNCETLGM